MIPIRFSIVAAIFLFSSIFPQYHAKAFPREEETDDQRRERCKAKCGGEQAENEAFKDGKGICLNPETGIEGESWGDPVRVVVTPCELDCMDAKGMIEKDQLHCFCKTCEETVPFYTYIHGFCSAPGVGRIGHLSQCAESFCNGKGDVKFYGRAYCESG